MKLPNLTLRYSNLTYSQYENTFRTIISIDFIITLGSVGCYILLQPPCKVEMQVETLLFFGRRVMTLGCR